VLEQALATSVRMSELWSRTELTASLAIIAAARGDRDRADQLVAEADGLKRDSDVFAVAYVDYARARVREMTGDFVGSADAYLRALEVMGTTEYVVPKAWMQLRYVELLLKAGRAADARLEYERAHPYVGETIAFLGDRVAAVRAALASSPTTR